MVRYKKLRTVMYANEINQKTLGKEIGRSATYMSQRITGKVPFDMDDVYSICNYLKLPIAEISEYFPHGGENLVAARSLKN